MVANSNNVANSKLTGEGRGVDNFFVKSSRHYEFDKLKRGNRRKMIPATAWPVEHMKQKEWDLDEANKTFSLKMLGVDN